MSPVRSVGAPSLKFRCVPKLRYQYIGSFRFRVPLCLQSEVCLFVCKFEG